MESPVDLANKRCRQVGDRWLQIDLAEGHQGRDVNHESLGRPEATAGRNTLPGITARVVFEVMTAAMVVFRRLALKSRPERPGRGTV